MVCVKGGLFYKVAFVKDDLCKSWFVKVGWYKTWFL